MLKQNIIITYSNQKAREIKTTLGNPLDKVTTLSNLVNEIFEQLSFKKILNPIIATSFIYKIIQDSKSEYFDFISQNSDTLDLIYDFLLKVNSSKVGLSKILSGNKFDEINSLNIKYLEFKDHFDLVDNNDLIKFAIDNIDKYDFSNYEEIFIDNFEKENIKFYKSDLELELITLLSSKAKGFSQELDEVRTAELYKLKNQVFDINEEVQSALKLSRKLLEEDNNLRAEDICIVTTDISEYAPIFRLYLTKYELKGFDSKGIALNLYNGKKSSNPQINNAFNDIDKQIKVIKKNCIEFNIHINTSKMKDKIVKDTYILEDKIGIELTEANQLLGLNKKYEHIIFIGTDINHFPPKRSDNFLYTSEIAQEYFCENSYFESSLLQYNELKRLAKNLYITYPMYKEKRKLSSSIIIDKNISNSIDISSVNAKKNKIKEDNFLSSLLSNEYSKYDGLNVNDVIVNHLSASQLGSYAKCPFKYLYTYKLAIRHPRDDEEGFDVMQQGTLMHSCFEEFARKILGNKTLGVDGFKSIMLNVLEDEYQKFLINPRNEINQENIYHKIFKYTLAKGLTDDREDGLLIKFILEYENSKEDLNYFSNSEFEKEFALDSELKPYTIKDNDDRNYFIKGFIDRFDNLEKTINIIDYKSKKADGVLQDKLDEIREFKDFQLGLYTLFASEEYKKEVDSYLLTFKTKKNLSTKFARVATNEDLIPKYRGKDIGILYDTSYKENLKTNIFTIKEKIEQGDFRFDNSNEDYCGYCEIRNMCNQSILNKER
ncbi:MAG: hypothetical protein CL624_07440 [Arcobacter sp.]|nr:hypothetical protein [Arcobacter sp.]|tara:strand:+ start:4131 stop:6449 length:2319 start_codon:yes stop_codon:yes gene_type:complete